MKKLTLIFASISTIAFATILTMNNYQCSKCSTVVQSESSPNSGVCSKGATHHWNNLGEVGDKNYQCSKCATVVKSKSSPNSGVCPKGATHHWSKL